MLKPYPNHSIMPWNFFFPEKYLRKNLYVWLNSTVIQNWETENSNADYKFNTSVCNQVFNNYFLSQVCLILEDYLIKHKKEVQKTAFMYCVHMYINGNLWGGKDKGEWWRGWIQVWYIWYIVRTFVNATMYPHLAH
jgi:hypothetical protein